MAIVKSFAVKDFFGGFAKVKIGQATNKAGKEFTAIRCYETGNPRYTPVSISEKVTYESAKDLMAQTDKLQVVEAVDEKTGNTFYSLCPLHDFSDWGEELHF